MSLPIILIALLWIVFIGVWVVSMFFAKRTLSRPLGREILARLVIVGVIIIAARNHLVPQLVYVAHTQEEFVMQWIGVLLCGLGVALAVWARMYLGSNWGMPMSIKENAELVTTGPYAYIRNPIYSGILLAMLGSSLAIGLIWAIIFVVFGAYCIYSSYMEEKIMLKEFPETYPAYKARTKMLVPFVF